MTVKELEQIGFINMRTVKDNFQHLRYKLDKSFEIVLAGYDCDWRLQEFQQPNNEEKIDIITIPKNLETIDDVQKLINALT